MIVTMVSGKSAFVRAADIVAVQEATHEKANWSEPAYVPHKILWRLYRRTQPERTGYSYEPYRAVWLRNGQTIAVRDTLEDLCGKMGAE